MYNYIQYICKCMYITTVVVRWLLYFLFFACVGPLGAAPVVAVWANVTVVSNQNKTKEETKK